MLPNLHAVIFEIYPSYINEIDSSILREQLEELKKLWNIKGSKKINRTRIEHHYKPSKISYIEWLNTLGMLVTDQKVDNILEDEIAEDKAITVYKKSW